MVFHHQSDVFFLCRIAWLDRLTQICFAFVLFIVLTMIGIRIFNARDDGISPSKDVSLSLSYCMVGSSNTNWLCFLFSFIALTMIAEVSIFNARDDGISPSKWCIFIFVVLHGWMPNINLVCFLFSTIQGGGFYISGGQTSWPVVPFRAIVL